MAQESNVDIKVRLGVLAHANVGQPGRRLVWHRAGGWVPVPARRSGLAGWLSHAGVLPVLGVLGMGALVAWLLLHADAPPSALAQGSVPVPAASSPAKAQVPSPDAGHLGAAGAGEPVSRAASSPVPGVPSPPPGDRMAPRPEWAAASGATPAGMAVAPAHAFPAPDTGETRAPRRPTRPPASGLAGEIGQVAANPEARSARSTRRPGRGPADLAAPAAPASQAPPNDGVVASPNRSDLLVAITSANSIVVPDTKGLPASFRVGERLPSGARLLRVDPRSGEAETDRGLIRLE